VIRIRPPLMMSDDAGDAPPLSYTEKRGARQAVPHHQQSVCRILA